MIPTYYYIDKYSENLIELYNIFPVHTSINKLKLLMPVLAFSICALLNSLKENANSQKDPATYIAVGNFIS